MLVGNTFKEQAESRKRMNAYLALQAQVNAAHLKAAKLYQMTGQPGVLPDTRTTSEKLADYEEMKVELRQVFGRITDGQAAIEAVSQLTPDEVAFAAGRSEDIVEHLKPRFKRGIPAAALASYVKALYQKEQATNGVSFETQEATSQSLLKALQTGSRVLNLPAQPFTPIQTPLQNSSSTDYSFGSAQSLPSSSAFSSSSSSAFSSVHPTGSQYSSSNKSATSSVVPTRPTQNTPEGLPPGALAELKRISAEKKRQRDEAGFEDPISSRSSSRPKTPFQQELEEKLASRESSRVPTPALHSNKTIYNMDWNDFRNLFGHYLENNVTDVTRHIPQEYISSAGRYKGYLKSQQPPGGLPEIRESLREAFNAHLRQQGDRPHLLHERAMETASYKRAASAPTDEAGTEMGTERGVAGYAQKMSDMGDAMGKGLRNFRTQSRNYYIKGRGLRKSVDVDTSRGIPATTTYVPFGKYIVNPAKLRRNRLEMKTMRGGAIIKYPSQDLTANLAKILCRVLEDRMPDDHDLRELSAKEHAFLYGFIICDILICTIRTTSCI